jgi:hypothetical protein
VKGNHSEEPLFIHYRAALSSEKMSTQRQPQQSLSETTKESFDIVPGQSQSQKLVKNADINLTSFQRDILDITCGPYKSLVFPLKFMYDLSEPIQVMYLPSSKCKSRNTIFFNFKSCLYP